MSRPRKAPKKKADHRTIEEPFDWMAQVSHQSTVNRLRADPLGDDPLAVMFSDLLLGRAGPMLKEDCGKVLADLLETATGDQLEKFFQRIVRMKRAAALPPHRNAGAYHAYSVFCETEGREPSKRELKTYLMDRPEIYRDLPPAWDSKAWHRLIADAGLGSLPKSGMKP